MNARLGMIFLIGLLCACTEDKHSRNTMDTGSPSDAAKDVQGAGGSDMGDGGLMRDQDGAAISGPKDRAPLPRSTARIAGRVLDVAGNPLGNVALRAGGQAVLSSRLGLFEIDEVFGSDYAQVSANASGFVPTQLPIRIADDKQSFALIFMQSLEGTTATTADEDQVVTLAQNAELELNAGTLVYSWAASVSGPVTINFGQVFGAGRGVASLPGDGRLQDGSILKVDAGFYLGARQGGSILALGESATLRFQIQGYALPNLATDAGVTAPVSPDAGVSPQALTLFRFDEVSGRFTAVHSVAAESGLLELSLSELGTYVLGTVMEASGCSQLHLSTQSSADIADACVRSYSNHYAGVTESNAQGNVCLVGHEDQMLVDAFVGDGTAWLALEGRAVDLVSTDATPTMCSPACADVGDVTLDPLPIGCISGSVEGPENSGGWFTVETTNDYVLQRVEPDQAFCIEVEGTAASIAADQYLMDCVSNDAATIPIGNCDSKTCLDLGTVHCCLDYERCETPDWDDDCDGTIDEGCLCGSTTCSTQSSLNACCTAANACGAYGVAAESCFPLGVAGTTNDPACVDEMVALGNSSELVSGCCRTDQRCGLMDTYFGCIAREEYAQIVSTSSSFSAINCTP